MAIFLNRYSKSLRRQTLLLLISFLFFILIDLVSFGQSGPGGIGKTDGTTELELWIMADEGVVGSSPITGISDLSGNGRAITIVGNPTLSTNQLNSSSVMVFDGNDYLQTDLSINAGSMPVATVICVYTSDGTHSVGAIFGEEDNSSSYYKDRYLIRTGSITGCSYGLSIGTYCSNLSQFFPANEYAITVIAYDEYSMGSALVDGDALLGFGSDFYRSENTTSTNLCIASQGGAYYEFTGSIAEVIVYSKEFNRIEAVAISNYLSAKYNLDLSASNCYDGDNSSNGDYDYDVSGIGSDFGETLISTEGSSIARLINQSNTGNNRYLHYGHKGDSLNFTQATNIPTGTQARLAREWYVSEINRSGYSWDVGNVDVQINMSGYTNFTASDLQLLIDTDKDGSYTDESIITGATQITGTNWFEFSDKNFSSGQRFTFAVSPSSSIVSLPVELDYFNVKDIGGVAYLQWRTLTETNCEYFAMEKSDDAINWSVHKIVNGQGNSLKPHTYEVLDDNPFIGTSYYRLKQVDFDGTDFYFDIYNLNINYSDLQIFPTLTSGFITIKGKLSPVDYSIYTPLGRNVSNKVKIINQSVSGMQLDVSHLDSGMYIFTVNEKYIHFFKD